MLMLILGIMFIYLVWTLMSPSKKKPEQRRFSIRKHRNKKIDDDDEE
jgi:hypothetical protein